MPDWWPDELATRADCVCECGYCRAGNCHMCEKSSFHAYTCRIERFGDQ